MKLKWNEKTPKKAPKTGQEIAAEYQRLTVQIGDAYHKMNHFYPEVIKKAQAELIEVEKEFAAFQAAEKAKKDEAQKLAKTAGTEASNDAVTQ